METAFVQVLRVLHLHVSVIGVVGLVFVIVVFDDYDVSLRPADSSPLLFLAPSSSLLLPLPISEPSTSLVTSLMDPSELDRLLCDVLEEPSVHARRWALCEKRVEAILVSNSYVS